MEVVILDDAFTSRQIMKRLLAEIPGVSPREFEEAEAALDWCASNEVDLMIVDYHLAGDNGLEFLSRVQRLPQSARCPVVFVTADETLAVRHAALRSGVSDFLVKPVDPDEFTARIYNLLNVRAEHVRLRSRVQTHLHRLEALWRLAVRTDIAGEELLAAMLEEGALALSPLDRFFGTVCEIRSDQVVGLFRDTKALIGTGNEEKIVPFAVGTSVPIDWSVSNLLPVDGSAKWWNICEDDETKNLMYAKMGLRAVIGARFYVDLKTYSLVFFSFSEPARPFDQNDATYVELLAAFFASKIREMEHAQVIRFQALHDPLTALLNRNGLRLHMKDALAAHEGAGSTLAVCVIDVDPIREISETMGTDVVETSIKTIANRLEGTARTGDALARIGPSSFAACFKNLKGAEQAEALTRGLIDAIGMPIDVDGQAIRLTSQAGVALFPADARTADDLVGRADAAVDQAKRHATGAIEFSSPEIDARLRRRQAMRQAILQGLDANEFSLHLQPEIDLRSGLPVAAEALIRWNNRSGRIEPGEFIPFAEQNGLIHSISLYVMRQALADAARLAELNPSFRLFFNLSAHDLADPSFLAKFAEALDEHPVNPHNVGVEVTESTAMIDVARTVTVLLKLQAMGIAVALDDFGTGHSSLAILKTLPIDIIKIDRSFIADLPNDPADVAITRNAINFGHDLGRTVLVEGVETQAQLDWLNAYGCDRAQGFHLGRPMPLHALAEWMMDRCA
jgi:diguanylate cyclase (GGDEF)-like protein